MSELSPECSTCGDSFNSIFGEKHCINCCKERQGITTVRAVEKRNATLQARIAELETVLKSAHAFIAVMCGRGPDCIIPETIDSPIGVPIKIGEIVRDIKTALESKP